MPEVDDFKKNALNYSIKKFKHSCPHLAAEIGYVMNSIDIKNLTDREKRILKERLGVDIEKLESSEIMRKARKISIEEIKRMEEEMLKRINN